MPLTVVHFVEDDVVRGGEVVESEGEADGEERGRHRVHRDAQRERVVRTPIKRMT